MPSNPDFTHFLVTRFNIRVNTYGPEKLDSTQMDDIFLQHRKDLFEKYCWPSVKNQISQNFMWLIYFDIDTNPVFIQQIKSITNGPVPVMPILVPGFEEMLEDLRSRLRHVSTPFVITSRLDNDDMISVDFISSVQKLFMPSGRTILNFTMGYEIDLTHHIIKKWTSRYKNQFISCIEAKDSDDLLSVYGFSHLSIPEDMGILNEGKGTKWAYTRHAFNYSAQKINARPVFKINDLFGFPFLKGVLKINFLQTAVYTFRWLMHTSLPRTKRYYKAIFRKA